MMYRKPELKVFSAAELQEALGPVQAQSGQVTVYGGGSTSQLNEGKIAEYRVVKVEMGESIVTQKEVTHA